MSAPSLDATLIHTARLLAAGLLLAAWQRAGARSVRLDSGADGGPRLLAEPLAPENADGAVWLIEDIWAREILVATRLAGARYRGWDRAIAAAERELTGGAE